MGPRRVLWKKKQANYTDSLKGIYTSILNKAQYCGNTGLFNTYRIAVVFQVESLFPLIKTQICLLNRLGGYKCKKP